MLFKAVKSQPSNLQESPTGEFWNKDIFYKNINHRKEIIITWLGIVLTTMAVVFTLSNVGQLSAEAWVNKDVGALLGLGLFAFLILGLVYGNYLYQFTRIGYFTRLSRHTPVASDKLNALYQKNMAPLTFLLPSYKEEIRVIEQSIISTALQEYPNKKVVLLIDDPAHPKNAKDWMSLEEARRLPQKVQSFLAEPRLFVQEAYDQFKQRAESGSFNSLAEAMELVVVYEKAAQWFLKELHQYELNDHTDKLFAKITFEDNYYAIEARIKELDQHVLDADFSDTRRDIDIAYRRLLSRFIVTITTFERKKYENLSHEPNKAMNLNSYITLLGKSFVEDRRNGKLYLEEASKDKATFHVPHSEYLITLDADSLLTSDYALRLVNLMETEGNEKIAVAQTPYSAIPNPPSILERTAGATTDMQFLIHQGFTQFHSTFWVGANALLRTKALNDIVEETEERGYKVKIFIQDRTVIEDTESSVDLVVKGWKLFNYPQRMSYSATPPDFGSLYIQRCRWANGGLIIYPKLFRRLMKGPFSWSVAQEAFFRTHYLTSIAAVNIGLPVLLLFSFDSRLNSPWLVMTSLPYYFFYGRDLMQAGYKFVDLLRVYAMNLMMIPVNLAGVFKSIHQGVVKHKIPFKRTPKVSGRTTSAVSHLLVQYAILVGIFVGSAFSLAEGKWLHAWFGIFNGLFYVYAITQFIGLKESYEDIFEIRRKESPMIEKTHKCPCFECQKTFA